MNPSRREPSSPRVLAFGVALAGRLELGAQYQHNRDTASIAFNAGIVY